jgi:cation diffusion facilitator CzcD-associated flavoprotein CzcO
LEAAFQQEVKANYTEIRKIQRATTNGHPYFASYRPALSVSDEERDAIYEAEWQHGGLRFRAAFADLLTDKAANDTAAEFIRAKIRETVHDPAVAERHMPRDHPFATKRPPIDTRYSETYNRQNVTLVDVRESPIAEITPTGCAPRRASTRSTTSSSPPASTP